METQVNNAQVGETHVDSANGGVNGSQEVADLKDVLGPIFGTEFKTDEDALQSVIHAKNMSGKVGQLENQIADLKNSNTMTPELEQKINTLEQTVKQQTFFAQNPQYNTPEAKALIADMGGDAEAVIQKDSFKTAFEAIKKSNDIDANKSVLHTNPRLGNAQDNMTKASEAQKAGNYEQAAQAATAGVLEAFEMK